MITGKTPFAEADELDDALRDANEAIRLAPTYSFVFRGRANVYNDMGKYDLAVNDYDHAIQLAPNDGGLFIERGKVFRTQSRFDQAISDFNHALDVDKKWTAAYRERGLTYKMMGRSLPAIDDLSTYDRLQPGDQEVAQALTDSGALGHQTMRRRRVHLQSRRHQSRLAQYRKGLLSQWSLKVEPLPFL